MGFGNGGLRCVIGGEEEIVLCALGGAEGVRQTCRATTVQQQQQQQQPGRDELPSFFSLWFRCFTACHLFFFVYFFCNESVLHSSVKLD